MNPEQNSISIINKSNGQVLGENAQALPVKLTGQFSWTRYFAVGFVLAIVVCILFVATVKKSVVEVEISGKADDFQIYQVN